MSMMSLAVMQKVSQIGILKAMGAKDNFIRSVFFLQSFIISFFSGIIGIFISYFFILIDNHYNLIETVFPKSFFFDFPLILKVEYAYVYILSLYIFNQVFYFLILNK